MSSFDYQQICINGHRITSNYNRFPNLRKKFCDKCGQKTIYQCPNCQNPIKGDLITDIIVISDYEEPIPDFCYECGKPFPWYIERKKNEDPYNYFILKLKEFNSYLEIVLLTDLTSLENLKSIVNNVGKSHSGSWIGYQANVYYEDFKIPPAGAFFSQEWGFYNILGRVGRGEWIEYNDEDILNELFKSVNRKFLEEKLIFRDNIDKEIYNFKEVILSFCSLLNLQTDSFVDNTLTKFKDLKIYNYSDLINYIKPKNVASRDERAIEGGYRIPLYITVKAKVDSINHIMGICKNIKEVLTNLILHLELKNRIGVTMNKTGNKIFIGHGRSKDWLELKDFLKDRLNIEHEEFNREPVAGLSVQKRLSDMLDNASFAFIIFTPENETSEGLHTARLNVVHELGLFQGRLGFDKAVVVLQEGCDAFSNIDGLQQIRFSKNISETFEEIRRLLEKHRIIT